MGGLGRTASLCQQRRARHRGRRHRPGTALADTSALVAIVFAEPERDAFVAAIERAERTLVSSVTVTETRMVVHARRGQRAAVLVDDLLRLPFFEIVAFGKGNGHAAALNFGDVFSYALAKTRGLPLLFKGEDFAETDIARAVEP
jgi:ribonuclease VapC